MKGYIPDQGISRLIQRKTQSGRELLGWVWAWDNPNANLRETHCSCRWTGSIVLLARSGCSLEEEERTQAERTVWHPSRRNNCRMRPSTRCRGPSRPRRKCARPRDILDDHVRVVRTRDEIRPPRNFFRSRGKYRRTSRYSRSEYPDVPSDAIQISGTPTARGRKKKKHTGTFDYWNRVSQISNKNIIIQ